ncbi:MAG: 4-alpha-glucanotransferase [Desulfuromonas sp.]|nr:MAG: 4-alpha-glucanotransferase [Desulfuromonas sp.]
MKISRSSGILLHPTSLPGRGPVGSLGESAYRFIDFLHNAGQGFWQILPLGPTGYGDSPYSAFSAFAGNPLLIDMERLVDHGDLPETALETLSASPEHVRYDLAHREYEHLLRQALPRFTHASPERRTAYEIFCREQADWLDDYALFRSLHQHLACGDWSHWPQALRLRLPEALSEWRERLADEIELHRYSQFIFYEQWFALRDYAHSRNVSILGDLPIFVAYDSADVWAHPELFLLDDEGRPSVVAGVPPDYFSATGQRWGNPLYDWKRMGQDRYAWWRRRLSWNLTQTDWVRIDHFRGFSACWEIPADEETAINGRWREVPGHDFFETLTELCGELPLIAEDLGIITPDVETLRDRFDLPGMKILQFAFGGENDNPYLPHNHIEQSVVYTGTHDNDTTLGWWKSLDAQTRQHVANYLGHTSPQLPTDLIRLAQASVAALAILPLQDLLALGEEARTNRPGAPTGNWSWRVPSDSLTSTLAVRLKEQTALYQRLPYPRQNREIP